MSDVLDSIVVNEVRFVNALTSNDISLSFAADAQCYRPVCLTLNG